MGPIELCCRQDNPRLRETVGASAFPCTEGRQRAIPPQPWLASHDHRARRAGILVAIARARSAL